ncbi:hypothetical protein [Staphylococcus massiliensis]|nr:hypothetical protein [Staphylococcus massiliensis]
MIYLDHASTTKPTQSALNTYLKAQEKLFLIVKAYIKAASLCSVL